MSLINDALKRASKTDRDRARPAESHTSLQPVAEPRAGLLPLVLGVVVVLALGLAGCFFWQWWKASHPPARAQQDIVIAAAPAQVVQKPAPPTVMTAPTPAPAPMPAPALAPPTAPAPAPAPEPVAAPPAKPVAAAWPVDLKLAGIFFSKTNPRAIINGRTVVVGDEIEGIRVSKIEQDRVTVEWNGQVKSLVME